MCTHLVILGSLFWDWCGLGLLCCLGLVWFGTICDEKINFGIFYFTFGQIAHGENEENWFSRFGATTILLV